MPDKLTDNLANNSPISSNSLSDTEIIKALEYCGKDEPCKKCPYDKLGISKELVCSQQLFFDALDLINRQEEKNSNLTSDLTSLQNDLTSAKAEVEKWQGGYMTQKQEIANLEVELKAMRGAANSYKAEIERLKRELNLVLGNSLSARLPHCVLRGDSCAILTKDLAGYDKLIAEIKAEAYRECIEKVKESIKNLEYNARTTRKTVKVEELKEQMEWVLHTVVIETLNNLLTELVGDGDGK